MICRKPYVRGLLAVGCGQCLHCRVNRRRVWKHRMLLEGAKAAGSCFVTLTYDPESEPKDGSLQPRDLQLWLKRLRYLFAPEKVRFFGVGEYGDQSWRPHYHAALFGMPADVAGGPDGMSGLVSWSWPFGFTFVGSFTAESADYVAGYVTKKLTKKGDCRLDGRHPEFARMSLRPGLGRSAIEDLAREIQRGEAGLEFVRKNGDVPAALAHGGKYLPLGQYLRRMLRKELGFGKWEETPEGVKKQNAAALWVVLENAFRNAKNCSKSVSDVIVDNSLQELLNRESRLKIWGSSKKEL